MNYASARHNLCGLIPTNTLLRRAAAPLMACALALLSACGGGGGGGGGGGATGNIFRDSFFLNGTVSNLAGGQLTLVNDGDTASATTISANGSFRMPISVPSGGSYNVTVGTAAVVKAVDKDHTVFAWAEKIHGTLLIGDVGDRLIEVAAGLGLVMIITGLYLFWPRQATWSEVLVPDWTAKGRKWWKPWPIGWAIAGSSTSMRRRTIWVSTPSPPIP